MGEVGVETLERGEGGRASEYDNEDDVTREEKDEDAEEKEDNEEEDEEEGRIVDAEFE